MCSHSCRVPSDAQGEYVLQVSFDTGPLGGNITGRAKVKVNAE